MSKIIVSRLHSTLTCILTIPTPDDLWQLQSDLLAHGGETAHKAREVAREFHSYLRDLESKTGSRSASRWGAVFATAAVSSVGLQEMFVEHEDPLKRLLESGITAMLEISSAAKHVQAWEMEASLMYYDVAWYLYGELWEVSEATRPKLSLEERQAYINQLLNPVVNSDESDVTKSMLLARLFQVVLAARMWPLLMAAMSS